MEERGILSGDVDFWTRARRHLLKYGGEFVDFVPVRAEGAFSTMTLAGACWTSPRAR
jgi:hypothetical protein